MEKATKWRGPKRKNLHKLKQWIIQKIEDTGEVRFSELWIEGRLLFKSPRYLSKCLKELKEENIIEEIRISHKNIRYRKAGSFDLLKKILLLDSTLERLQPKILVELSNLNKIFKNPMQKTSFITHLVLMELTEVFSSFESTLKAPTQLYAKWGLLFLEKTIRRFEKKLKTCRKICPKETEDSIRIVYWILQKSTIELSKSTNILSTQHPLRAQVLPAIDQERMNKTEKYYQRLLKAF